MILDAPNISKLDSTIDVDVVREISGKLCLLAEEVILPSSFRLGLQWRHVCRRFSWPIRGAEQVFDHGAH